ncbi:FtsK/SpoIIIE domain-containing protein [Sulfobacillus thermotolerans]|uniref:FtsK/SpoIIIE domain-containing protein n=1 Tax=Sulfobacillus thermotolerans TaxID=338644 RepID=UPI0033671075
MASTADLAHAAHVLDAGFATSKPDVAWTTLPDGTTARRMTVVAADGLIHPHWAMGFHAGTMQEWVQWATQWAETALHHAGITGTWTVSAEGIVRRGRESASSPRGEDAPPVEPPKSTVEGLPDATQWGQDGLRWGQLRAAAADPLPVLSGPIPPERVQDVVRVLGHLGFPDTVAIGGQRGLTVDVAKIRPPAALAKRILGESATLAGQLGHGELPLRMAYVEGAPGVIAVERPRPDRQFVDLVTALARTDKQTRQSLKNMALPVCCLVKSDGTPFWSDAATWPHLLAGGTTGGGKTVSLVGWLASLMITVPPTRLRISLVDPKAGASFPWAKHAPHVDALVKTPQEVCQLVAQWADEADARFEEFAHGGVEDLAAAMAAGWTQYPYRLLVVDEYKDLKDQLEKDDLKELERNIGRLGQKARGAGLLLWIATQHPLAETIDSTLKANLPTRLALKVANTVGSQVILDSPGAETLLGRGDALFKSSSMGVAIRGQTPLATEGVWQVIRDGWAKKA